MLALPQPVISAEDIRPNIQQKGVDMRIGLDIASLTLKEHARIIVLVTGDSDFVPAMKFARREGAQLFLVRLDHGVSPDLLEHADIDLSITYEDIKQNHQPTSSVPQVSVASRIRCRRPIRRHGFPRMLNVRSLRPIPTRQYL